MDGACQYLSPDAGTWGIGLTGRVFQVERRQIDGR